MVHPYAVLGFLAALLPLVATPGASLTLLIQHVIDRGRRQALPVVLGTVTGLYIHATLATIGLSALIMRSSQAFTAVKVIGAAYLIGLGLWTWRSARGRTHAPARRGLPVQPNSVYTQALLGNVLNPKAAAIYLTLAPQFIEDDRSFDSQILTLASAHALLTTLWLLAWTVLIRRTSRTLQKPHFKRRTAKITAVMFLALGIRSVAT
ncbi:MULTISPECIES: LysE family translocator [unclassified Streptomyces]|uniref:LysE family translocator n=1 Tax=unclassified Streptomyces TaxID=2593676 RepID=UPI002E18D8DD|nr:MULTISPECIES: LysE family translocator [unclassified Streptomyces]